MKTKVAFIAFTLLCCSLSWAQQNTPLTSFVPTVLVYHGTPPISIPCLQYQVGFDVTGNAVYACGPNGTWQQVSKAIQGVQLVDAALSRGGTDICNELNLAYAAGPTAPSLVTIWLAGNSAGTAYSCTTQIAFTTKGKYFKLINIGACVPVNPTGLSGPGCINFTPTTGNAVTVDVYDSAAQDPPMGYGFYDFGIINNNCGATNGCGGAANGIVVGSTNGGADNMNMSNVSIVGFGGKGYLDTNLASPNVHWSNPRFLANAIAMQHGSITEKFEGGVWSGNGCIELAASSTTPELYFTNPNTFGNTGGSCAAAFDFTNVGASPANLNLVNAHLENTSTTNAHYISGNVNVQRTGGVMEDDNSTGTGDWMVQLSTSGFIRSQTEVLSPRAYTNVYLLNGGTRAEINDMNGSPSVLTSAMFAGGANAAFATQRISPLGSANSPYLWKLESPISTSGLVAGGSISLAGTGACASLTGPTGGPWSGGATCTGSTGASTLTITPGTTAPHFWGCSGSDTTAGHELAGAQSGMSATSCTLKFSSVTSNDVIVIASAVAF